MYNNERKRRSREDARTRDCRCVVYICIELADGSRERRAQRPQWIIHDRATTGTHDRRNTRSCSCCHARCSPPTSIVLLCLAFTGRYYVSSPFFLVAEIGLKDNFVSSSIPANLSNFFPSRNQRKFEFG